jgi:hypothetical protein
MHVERRLSGAQLARHTTGAVVISRPVAERRCAPGAGPFVVAPLTAGSCKPPTRKRQCRRITRRAAVPMRAGRTACAVDRPETLVMALSAYELSTLRDGLFTLSRSVRDGLEAT